MKQIHILSILLWLLFTLPIAAQKEYDCSKYYGTWVYENQDTVFTVQFKKATALWGSPNNSKPHVLLVGNFKIAIKGKILYDHLKTLPTIIDERGKQYQPYSSHGIYLWDYLNIEEHSENGRLIGIIDPIKNYNNGEGTSSLWIKLLPDGRLKWTLMDYNEVRRHFPEMYENSDEPFTGYSMPTHAIFRKVK